MLTQAQKQRIADKIAACYVTLEAHYKRTFKRPTVHYDVRGGAGGKADIRANSVHFNATLAAHNFEDFIARTVPHEVAHLIDFEIHNKLEALQRAHEAKVMDRVMFGVRRKRKKIDVHGPSWQAVMRVLGVKDITRCHQYDAKVLGNYHEYKCACGATLTVGPKHHKGILRGRQITHRACGGVITSAMYVPKGATRAAAAPAAQVPAPKAPPAPRVGTKMDQAVQIVATHGGYSRDQVIAILMRNLNMSKAGATTYYYAAKKRC